MQLSPPYARMLTGSATSISNDTTIICSCRNIFNSAKFTIWTSHHGMLSLTDLLESASIAEDLIDSMVISANGTIVFSGRESSSVYNTTIWQIKIPSFDDLVKKNFLT